MFYTILFLLFLAVFALIGWRILARRRPAEPTDPVTYICPHCGENICDCYKEDHT